jgi:F0F1-type ATP synthase membrane subunit a
MLPFNIIGEVSRTLALAVRLFGNVMSGALIVRCCSGSRRCSSRSSCRRSGC